MKITLTTINKQVRVKLNLKISKMDGKYATFNQNNINLRLMYQSSNPSLKEGAMKDIEILKSLSTDTYMKVEVLSDIFGVSERTVRNYVKSINELEHIYGVVIKQTRGKGYLLHVTDGEKFDKYKEKSRGFGYVGSRKIRLPELFRILLQQSDYISLYDLSESMAVSRDTIDRDLDHLKPLLSKEGLKLVVKPHYGVKIEGDENSIRAAFGKYVVNSTSYLAQTQSYFNFIESADVQSKTNELKSIFNKHDLKLSKKTLDSFIDHLMVLIYRVYQRNYISDIQVQKLNIPETYYIIAKEMTNVISSYFQVEIPEVETLYLSSQLYGKTTSQLIPLDEKEEIEIKIIQSLDIIDKEFMTDFKNDTELLHVLTIHMYPLIHRITHRIELKNPLIKMVSSRYASVFLVALRFIELWGFSENEKLSEDEISYITLHFASHLDRKRKKKLDGIRRILILSEMGRGSIMLNRQKVERAFPEATVIFDLDFDKESIQLSNPDIILTTFDETNLDTDIMVFRIPEIVTDTDITRLYDFLVLNMSMVQPKGKNSHVLDLFDENLVTVIDSHDYLECIQTGANEMVRLGFANENFPFSVLERESKFNTIYRDGVAGPHSLVQNAIEEKIGIIVPKSEIYFDSKSVKIILLINVSKGNMFIHREISKLTRYFSDNVDEIVEIMKNENFDILLRMLSKDESKWRV